MNTMEQRLQLLESRVRQSQRTNRTLLFAIILIVGVAGARAQVPQATQRVSPPAQAEPQHHADNAPRQDGTIRAHRIVLVDKAGTKRVELNATEPSIFLRMMDEQGATRVALEQSATAASLVIKGADGNEAVSISVPPRQGEPAVTLAGPTGSTRLSAAGVAVRDLDERNRLSFSLINGNFASLGISQAGQQGPPSIELTATDRSRSFKIHDDAGRPLVTMFASEDGSTSVSWRHPSHDRVMQISSGASGGPTIGFFASANEDGSGGRLPFLQLGLDGDREPFVRMLDEAGKSRFAAPSD